MDKKHINEFAQIAKGYNSYINVNDALPTRNARCLVRFEYLWNGKKNTDYTIAIFSTSDNDFAFASKRPTDKVTHWMYLPTLETGVNINHTNESKALNKLVARINESKEITEETDIDAIANKYGFIVDVVNFYVSKKVYTYVENDLTFSYRYCIYLNDDASYLDLVFEPNTLKNKILEKIARTEGIMLGDITCFDVYTYGMSFPLTALKQEPNVPNMYELLFEKFTKEITHTEALFELMMDKRYGNFESRRDYVRGIVKNAINESKSFARKRIINENNTYDERTQLLLRLKDLASKVCFVDSYIDDFGIEHNAITDIISEYFIDFDNWKDVDDPIPYVINNSNCLRLAVALFDYDYIALTKSGNVDVKNSNNVDIAEIVKKLIDKDIIKKAYERVVF